MVPKGDKDFCYSTGIAVGERHFFFEVNILLEKVSGWQVLE
jgi:hypothetical protein